MPLPERMRSRAAAAVAWAVVSALLFAFSNVALRMVSEAGAFDVALIRSFVFALLLTPLLPLGAAPHMKQHSVRAHVALGLFALTTITTAVTWFLGLQALPLATATSLFSLKAAFAMFAAAVLLHERLDARKLAALCAGFAGATLLLEPDWPSLIGAAWVLSAAASSALNGVFYAQLVRAQPPSRVLVASSFLQIIVLAPVALIDTVALPTLALMMAGLSALLSIGVMYTLAWAYRGADVSIVALLEYLRLPFAAGLAYWFFSEQPSAAFYVGSVIIIASMVLAKPLTTRASGHTSWPTSIMFWRSR